MGRTQSPTATGCTEHYLGVWPALDGALAAELHAGDEGTGRKPFTVSPIFSPGFALAASTLAASPFERCARCLRRRMDIG